MDLHFFPTFLFPYPFNEVSQTGLNKIKACGFDEMFRSPVSNPLIMPVHAATCPPAEPPAATILFGSTPNFFEFFLIHLTADLPSSTH